MSDQRPGPYPLRLPAEQRERLERRARVQAVSFAALLRKYIDAGDYIETMRENNAAFPHPDDTDGPADTRTGQET